MSGDFKIISKKSNNQDDWIFLTKVSNEMEYQVVTGLLKTAEIPALSRTGEMDGFLKVFTGVPISGIDVLVPKDKYDEAYALINAPVDENELIDEESRTEGQLSDEEEDF